jgi:cytochrome P450 family 142 subfamily A polypeptide 1
VALAADQRLGPPVEVVPDAGVEAEQLADHHQGHVHRQPVDEVDLAGGLRAFSLFPEERAKLVADPTLIDSAVEEIIRWTSPVLNFVRTVTAPITLGGVDLVPGDRVLMLYQSANRDEAVFDDPDRLRIDRAPNPHVAFGFGPHFCLGASLARMEVKVVFEELFRRLPDIALVDPDALPERHASSFVAAVKTMPARFTPVRR